MTERTVPGKCLTQPLKNSFIFPFLHSRTEIKDILQQLVHLLSVSHQAGYLHNDLKANNVLVTLNPVHLNSTTPVLPGPPVPHGLSADHKYRVYLLDFGNTTHNAGYRYRLHEEVKANHALCPFLAPEVIRGQYTTPASDVYSLGKFLFLVK